MTNRPGGAQAGFHCEFHCSEQRSNKRHRQNVDSGPLFSLFQCFSSEKSTHWQISAGETLTSLKSEFPQDGHEAAGDLVDGSTRLKCRRRWTRSPCSDGRRQEEKKVSVTGRRVGETFRSGDYKDTHTHRRTQSHWRKAGYTGSALAASGRQSVIKCYPTSAHLTLTAAKTL